MLRAAGFAKSLLEDRLKRLRTPWNLSLWLGAAAVALCACKRSEGESCQVKTDCEDALVCCIASTAARGYCAASLDRCTLPRIETDGGRLDNDGG
jgi:hypothetical protein